MRKVTLYGVEFNSSGNGRWHAMHHDIHISVYRERGMWYMSHNGFTDYRTAKTMGRMALEAVTYATYQYMDSKENDISYHAVRDMVRAKGE